MTISRRSLLATTGAAAAGTFLSARPASAQAGVDGSKSAALFLTEDGGLKPATVFLASERASYVTGATIQVDGGAI